MSLTGAGHRTAHTIEMVDAPRPSGTTRSLIESLLREQRPDLIGRVHRGYYIVHFETYLVQNGRAVARIPWTAINWSDLDDNASADPPTQYTVGGLQRVRGLPRRLRELVRHETSHELR